MSEDVSGLTQGARRIADKVEGWLDKVPTYKKASEKPSEDNANMKAYRKATEYKSTVVSKKGDSTPKVAAKNTVRKRVVAKKS